MRSGRLFRLLLILTTASVIQAPGALGTALDVGRRPEVSPAPRVGAVLENEWPQLGYSGAHSNFNPVESMINPSNVATLEEKWSETLASTGTAPVLADGRVFVAAFDVLSAFDAATGSSLWTVNPGATVLNRPAVDGGVLYVTGSESVFAFDAGTGTELWQTDLHAGQLFLPPVVGEGLVVAVGPQASQIVALDAGSGGILWTATLEGTLFLPAIAGGLIYLVHGSTLTALDSESGLVFWSHAPIEAPIGPGPAIAGSVGYVASIRRLYVFDAASGDGIFNVPSPDAAVSLAVAGGIIYLGQQHRLGSISAIDSSTGVILWTTHLIQALPRLVVANGVVYAAAGRQLYALDGTTGTVLLTLRFKQTQGAPSAPIVAKGMVYLTQSNLLLALGLPPA